MTTIDRAQHDKLANAIRGLAMDGVEKAKSGHPGLPMGAADVATVLFTRIMKYDAADPRWPDRDRFVLSAGHGSMLLYALLYLTGVPGLELDDLKKFRQLESKTPGHPENFMTLGVETTTGPLGQGLATSVGMAMAERMLAAEFGKKIVDHHTYVLASDGDLMEGISQEAIALAGHQKLNKLIVLWDDNGISIDGPLSITDNVDQVARFKACGWRSERVDGHDPEAIEAAIRRAQKSSKPTMIACKTIIGFGAPKKQGTSKAHGEALGAEELEAAKKNLGITGGAFEVAADVLKAWREAGKAGTNEHANWRSRFGLLSERKRDEFERRLAHGVPAKLAKAILAHKKALIAAPQAVATRKASELALEAITPVMPELVMGSADLTPSNNTRTKAAEDFTPKTPKGRYVRYGIREHGMAAAMNGITLHGGFRTGGGTFLVFADYARPAMRLAALMGLPIVYVMTHDSIGLGEDGPTHQPVEQIASLRLHAQHACLPPGGHDRDGGSLAVRDREHQGADRARPLAPEPAAAAHRRHRHQPLRQGRLRASGGRGRQGAGHALRLGLRGRDRGRCSQAPGREGREGACRLRALAGNCCWRRTRPRRPRSSAMRR